MFSRISTTLLLVLAAFTIFVSAKPWPNGPVGGGSGGGGSNGGITSHPATTTVSFTSAPATTTISSGQCNTGSIQCCQSVQSPTSAGVPALLGLLGIVLENVNILIGITCTPISVIGVGGNSCTAQTVCCQNNNFNGVVALGCTPINVNL